MLAKHAYYAAESRHVEAMGEVREAVKYAMEGQEAAALMSMLRATAHLHQAALFALVWLLTPEEVEG